jgi:hypothetical protein
VQGIGHLLDVERVDDDRVGQLLGRPGHLAQHQDPPALGLAGHVLLGHEVHAIPQGGHQADVGQVVESHQGPEGQGAVQVPDRHPAEGAEAPVDLADALLHLALQDLVLPHLAARWHRHRHQGHLAAELGVALQEPVERLQPPRDALAVIQAVHRQNHAAAGELGAQAHDGVLHLLVLHRAGEGVVVDAHGEGADPDGATVVAHHAQLAAQGRGAQQARRGVKEVMGVVLRVEADQVGPQQALEDLAAPGQLAEDLEGGERDVQEKADGRLGQPLAQQGRQQHQVVVVNPDGVARDRGAHQGVAEEPVGGLVRLPLPRVVDGELGEVVGQGPQRLVGETQVEVVHHGLAEVHRQAPFGGEALGHLGPLLGAEPVLGDARPAHPQRALRLVGGGQTRRQTAGARLEAQTAALFGYSQRKPVGGNQQPRNEAPPLSSGRAAGRRPIPAPGTTKAPHVWPPTGLGRRRLVAGWARAGSVGKAARRRSAARAGRLPRLRG